MSFEYIKGVCNGGRHWLSLVLLDLVEDGKQADTAQGDAFQSVRTLELAI